MNLELAAFAEADFTWVRPLDSVWRDPPSDVPDLNAAVVDTVAEDFFRRTRDPSARPIGHVVVGTAGVGKTHMMGRLRSRMWGNGGWFVLLDIVGLKDFWSSVALCFANALQQPMPDGRTQGEAVLAGVARSLRVEEPVQSALRAPEVDSLKVIALLLGGLAKLDRVNATRHADVFRALYLFCAPDFTASNFAYAWLQGLEGDEAKARDLGFASPQRPAEDLVRGVSWIMGLAGPTLVAVDQIDGLLNPSSFVSPRSKGGDEGEEPPLVEILAAGLMELHDVRHRGMTVVACLEDTWTIIRARSIHAAIQRFGPARRLLGMRDAAAVERLIADRLAAAYDEVGFAPPYPTWPFSPEAVASATSLLPRQILMRCEDHRRHCAEQGDVTICRSLAGAAPEPVGEPEPPRPPNTLDDLYGEACRHADVAALLSPTDDAVLGAVLRDILGLYARQLPLSDTVDVENRADPAQKKPPLHGRLTFTFHAEGDREEHYCFRVLEHTHWLAFQSRLGAALTASGIDRALGHRHLFLVRRAPMPGTGAKTLQLVNRFGEAGGVVLVPGEDDLRAFVALRSLRDASLAGGDPGGFDTWLRARRPLLETAFFKAAGLAPPPHLARLDEGSPSFPGANAEPSGGESTHAAAPRPASFGSDAPRPAQDEGSRGPGQRSSPSGVGPHPVGGSRGPPPTGGSAQRGGAAEGAIPIGRRVSPEAEPVLLPTALLPRHTLIVAGAGSGKTVLLRRMVEEAALLGIPAVLLDPNNDLARLGEPWPDRPPSFTAEDEDKARQYFGTVEVRIWTPGSNAGNPLSLSVLPDFLAIGEDADEREQAVAMAVETLSPMVGLTGGRGPLKRGVLTEGLRYFARRGGGRLPELVALLSDLPDSASSIDDAGRLGSEMANLLRAALATNPLLRTEAPALDAGLLFQAEDPARTRLSVVNLAGLASEAARQDFVNRLQMTLFGWIKKHPSPVGRLYVMDEAQIFAPAQGGATSRQSAHQLASQARKYGLGMILATQVPKGVDNRVVSNCTTHFYGRMSSPATIQATREMMGARGGAADDVGRLQTSEFYFSTEAAGRPAKIRAPLCLSHHPNNPLSPDEVLVRARAPGGSPEA